jgi:hypothetical protein
MGRGIALYMEGHLERVSTLKIWQMGGVQTCQSSDWHT